MQLVSQPTLSEFVGDLGPNWRIKFADADGFPLTMLSFAAIDFGAISYKEVFQNVKTILTTPLFSAALERTLGIDQNIVDLPIDRAAEATVAIIDALYFWEPRCEIKNIEFEPDVLNGKLAVNLTLRVRNVIFGTDTEYDRRTIYTEEPIVPPTLPSTEPEPDEPIIVGPPGPQGPKGPPGMRGSLWFSGTVNPTKKTVSKSPTQILEGPQGPVGPQGERGFIWLSGTGDPVTPQDKDMYLNGANGDVWQYDGATKTWRRTNNQ